MRASYDLDSIALAQVLASIVPSQENDNRNECRRNHTNRMAYVDKLANDLQQFVFVRCTYLAEMISTIKTETIRSNCCSV